MANPSLERSTSLMWSQSEVLAAVNIESSRPGRGWEEDTAPITRPVSTLSAPSTILLEEEDLEEVLELASLDGSTFAPSGLSGEWWATSGAAPSRRAWHQSAAKSIRVLVQGLLFRLGWAHLSPELEAASEPCCPPLPLA